MSKTLLTGATGTLGTALQSRLLDTEQEVRAASRLPPAETVDEVEWVTLDLLDGTGIEEALTGVDRVVHTATAPQGDTEAVDVEGTKRLLAAANDADIDHFLYVSIVGVDEIPFSYYQHKYTAEQAVEGSTLPSTILRATQFHNFLDEIFSGLSWLPVWALPTKIQLQPVDVGEVADVVVEHVTSEPLGRADPVGGPEAHTLGELLTAYRNARGTWRPLVRLPIPGTVVSGFRAGNATCPDRAIGSVTWEEWLDRQYGTKPTVQTSVAVSET